MINIDEPIAGFYQMRMVRGGPLCGVKIWFGPPLEPWTREEMDRAPRWNAERDGQFIDVDRVWPACMKDVIDEAEYAFFVANGEHARNHDGFEPAAQPFRRTDWDTAPSPF